MQLEDKHHKIPRLVPRRIHLPLAKLDAAAPPPSSVAADGPAPLDKLGRPLHDLRISVTDRCNFRCSYCMPKEVFGSGFRFLPKPEILSFEEITRVARVFVGLGVRKLRLTGGEPLLRSQLHGLVAQLAELEVDVALTTNGSLLSKYASELFRAGLKRVTVSLDSLDDATFRHMNEVGFPVADVLAGIDAALDVGLPVKVNCVVRKGVNDDQVVDLAKYFKGSGVILRFIEFMDVGSSNGWELDNVTTGAEIIARLSRLSSLTPLDRSAPGEVAARYAYADGSGEVGVITSVSRPFCGACSRARLSAEGKLYTCLFAQHGTDLRSPLRDGVDDVGLRSIVSSIWAARSDRYSELRSSLPRDRPKIEMSYIGG